MLIKYNNQVKEINPQEYLTKPDTYKLWKENNKVNLAFSPLTNKEIKYLSFDYQEGINVIEIGKDKIKI